ncbi:MAG: ABC transporter substrate-binding protein [Pseudomonadota bacterium]
MSRRGSQIDRRSLISSGALASVLAATGLSAGASPKVGGTLRVALPETEVTRVLGQGCVFATLTQVSVEHEVRGALAQSWDADEDGRVWTFRLRDDAVFHDGRPVKSADVAASLRAFDAKVTARGVKLTLKEPDMRLPMRLADPRFAVRPGGDRSSVIGSGPYRVMEQGEDRVRLARVGDQGWFDAVEVISMADPDMRAEALLIGRVDVAGHLPLARVGEFARARHLVTHKTDETVLWARPAGPLAEAVLADGPTEGGAVRLRLARGSMEHPEAANAMSGLIREAAAKGIELAPRAAKETLTLGVAHVARIPLGAQPLERLSSLTGARTRVAFKAPPDLSRIGESWFFT